eukprot:TRINITY_DN726_c0_g2_i1.p1 TRINITY_DN726_c0_g2~~TRINITY_DN726_c0_g2_i1.p1  ORF type:complete len:256 (+),score=71.12 TRINITY_DN726_c0_g2_i1:44-769(+)
MARGGPPQWWVSLLLCPIGIAVVITIPWVIYRVKQIKKNITAHGAVDDNAVMSLWTVSKGKNSTTYRATFTWVAEDMDGKLFKCHISGFRIPEQTYLHAQGANTNSALGVNTSVHYNKLDITEWMIKEQYEGEFMPQSCSKWTGLIVGLFVLGMGVYEGIAGASYANNMSLGWIGIGVGCGVGVLISLIAPRFAMGTITKEQVFAKPGPLDQQNYLSTANATGSVNASDATVPPPPANIDW